jgi:hypothetical protein
MKNPIYVISVIFGIVALSITCLARAEVILSVPKVTTLAAKGAGVVVPFQLSCKNTLTGFNNFSIFGTVTQRRGNSIIQGNASLSGTVNCDGNPHDFQAIATLTCNGKPFKKGPAVISAGSNVNNSNFTIFESGDFQGVFKVR